MSFGQLCPLAPRETKSKGLLKKYVYSK
uniref:Uncharacterized protein n=1 Tax=Rhizophora mucronata TaxID=61149 RepID=A0A2P2NIN5_RHIMU